jgi:hypothetical protein
MCGTTFLSPACYPYVTTKSYPDASCAAMIMADRAAAPSCTYQPDVTRLKEVRQAVELADGANTVVEIRKEQAANWADQKKSAAFRKMRELWRKSGGGLVFP